jgi:ferredoxin-type protein NapF
VPTDPAAIEGTNQVVDLQRRRFLRRATGDAGDAAAPRRPPWARRPDEGFRARCTRCGECLRACPRGVLRTGDGGFPTIAFDRAGCSLCGDCARACAPRAIDPAARAVPFEWRVQVDARCLTRHGVECRVCGEACDARALRFVPTLGRVAQLHVERERCTGCGECLPVCPAGALALR